MKMLKWISAVVGCASLLSCSAERSEDSLFGPAEENTLVVDAVLLVDKPLPDLFVRRTLNPGKAYARDDAAVPNAIVSVYQGERDFRYSPDPDSAGRYLPPGDAPVVESHTEYSLQVQVGNRFVRARTTTPPRIKIDKIVLLDENTLEVRRRLRSFEELGEQVYSEKENRLSYTDGLLEAWVTPLNVPAYQLAIFSLDADSDFVLEADFLEADDYEEFERYGNSPPLEFDQGKVRLPWFAIVFGGRHLIRIYALDDNWYDYVRTTSADERGEGFFGGLIGDSFERPVFNLDGGIGLFVSASVDSLGFFVLPALENQD